MPEPHALSPPTPTVAITKTSAPQRIRLSCALGAKSLHGDSSELAAEPDKERPEGEASLELQLLKEPPRLADGLGRGLRTSELLDARVLPQLREPVDVRCRRLGS